MAATATTRRYLLAVCAFLSGLVGGAGAAEAQIDPPIANNVRERILGEFLSAEGEPAPEGGDQIGAFFNDLVVGRFVFESSSREFDITIYGDVPATPEVEGPTLGQPVSFRFYDSSTNTLRTDVGVETPAGESFTFTFQGQEVPPLPIPLPGFDLTPTRDLNLRLGVSPGGGGGGDGDGDGAGKYDVNADGNVDMEDAVAVLRLVGGMGSVGEEDADRADVNGDGRISVDDAIEVLRNR